MLFLKETRKKEDLVLEHTGRGEEEEFEGIRCPRCAWRPTAYDLWCCFRSADSPEPPFRACGTNWNTFATRGRCVGCGHQWKWTSCLRCSEWSLHDDWYERGSRHD